VSNRLELLPDSESVQVCPICAAPKVPDAKYCMHCWQEIDGLQDCTRSVLLKYKETAELRLAWIKEALK
jgi:predicted amidophosphoribosyltransferase